ncbi:TonB-dependent receptor [Tsuneonella sp. HG222]
MRTGLIVGYRPGLLALAVALASASSTAHAQAEEQASPPQGSAAQDGAAASNANTAAGTSDAAPELTGGDIVVTAQFRNQRLQDTPIAITAVSSDMLEARSQTSIVDIGQFAPSVNLSEGAGIQANSISAFIRGIGQEQGGFAFEPGVGIYIDDVYYGTTFGAVLDLTDLDRVEVLRGPQGTLAGKNSLGGAIKLFSKKPDEAGGGFVEATYGSYDRIDLRASAGFTIAEGLYARVSGVENHRRGFFKELDYGCVNPTGGIPAGTSADDCVTGLEGGRDLVALRGALRYAPAGSPLEINVIADVSRSVPGPVPTKLTFANSPLVRSYVAGNPMAGIPLDSRFLAGAESYTNYANFSEAGNYTTVFGFPYQVAPGVFTDDVENSANAWGISGTIDYELSGDLSLKSITAYREASGTTVNDPDASPVNLLKQNLTNVHEQFTQELRLTGKVGDFADFTVGGFYYTADDLADYRVQIPIFLYDFQTNDPVSNRSVAGFVHLELHPTESLNIIGGLRYTDDEKTYTFHRTNPDGSPVGTQFAGGSPLPLNFLLVGLDGLSSTYSGDRIDYRIGANYRFSDALMAYAQVSTGYKGGGINPAPFVPDQVQPFGPEELITYEAGFKADFFGRVLRLNGAAFVSDYSNIQRIVYFCPGSASPQCGQTTNIADARYKGLELETVFRPIDGLTIDGSLAYLDAEYTQIINPNALVTLDMVPPFASEWQASAGIEYAIELNGAGRIIPRADWSYLSEFYYQAVNHPFNLIPSRSLINARVSYESEDGDWTVSASVTNLADEFYYVGAAESIAALGNATGIVGRPREWALTVRRKF